MKGEENWGAEVKTEPKRGIFSKREERKVAAWAQGRRNLFGKEKGCY